MYSLETLKDVVKVYRANYLKAIPEEKEQRKEDYQQLKNLVCGLEYFCNNIERACPAMFGLIEGQER